MIYSRKKLPIGIRQNNPGNIEFSKFNFWEGEIRLVKKDNRYCTFKTPLWGIRAITKLIINYQSKYNLQTVEEIIYRWAPKADSNPTKEYCEFITSYTGFERFTNNQNTYFEEMYSLVVGIILFENARYIYPTATIVDGINLLLPSNITFPITEEIPINTFFLQGKE